MKKYYWILVDTLAKTLEIVESASCQAATEEQIATGVFVKSIAIVIDGYYMEVITMEEIRVSKKEIIRFRVAEMLRKVNKFVKSFSYRMEVIK